MRQSYNDEFMATVTSEARQIGYSTAARKHVIWHVLSPIGERNPMATTMRFVTEVTKTSRAITKRVVSFCCSSNSSSNSKSSAVISSLCALGGQGEAIYCGWKRLGGLSALKQETPLPMALGRHPKVLCKSLFFLASGNRLVLHVLCLLRSLWCASTVIVKW